MQPLSYAPLLKTIQTQPAKSPTWSFRNTDDLAAVLSSNNQPATPQVSPPCSPSGWITAAVLFARADTFPPAASAIAAVTLDLHPMHE